MCTNMNFLELIKGKVPQVSKLNKNISLTFFCICDALSGKFLHFTPKCLGMTSNRDSLAYEINLAVSVTR